MTIYQNTKSTKRISFKLQYDCFVYCLFIPSKSNLGNISNLLRRLCPLGIFTEVACSFMTSFFHNISSWFALLNNVSCPSLILMHPHHYVHFVLAMLINHVVFSGWRSSICTSVLTAPLTSGVTSVVTGGGNVWCAGTGRPHSSGTGGGRRRQRRRDAPSFPTRSILTYCTISVSSS